MVKQQGINYITNDGLTPLDNKKERIKGKGHLDVNLAKIIIDLFNTTYKAWKMLRYFTFLNTFQITQS